MKDLDFLIENTKDGVFQGVVFGGRSYGKSRCLDIISDELKKKGFTVKRVSVNDK